MASNRPPLILVANRLPFVLKRVDGKLVRSSSAGGLVTAVAPVVVASDGYWLGWSGDVYNPGESIPDADPSDHTPTAGLSSSRVIPISVEPSLFESYYNGFCNATLWPLFHSMPDRAVFSNEDWKNYKKVNQHFGLESVNALKKLSDDSPGKEPPIVWVHDYHLMVAPNTIRTEAENLRFKLSFFLHIPFPSWDIFRVFPWADEVLMGMLGCDMVGLHTEDYCQNFIDCCQRSLGCRVDRSARLVEFAGRSVRVRVLPVGIPFSRFSNMAEAAPTLFTNNHKIILGVDRLDYTKGLPQRLEAFELFLKKYPEYIGKVTMVQIAVPSREDVAQYHGLKENMEKLVGRINGRFTTPHWVPIRYIYGAVGQDQLAAFYRDSEVAFITPLRDGMNLVAKEYVACQIKSPPGVLILSPFAGAAGNMHEAIIVNIYEPEAVADALHRALTMPEDERAIRMNLLRRREKISDVNQWMHMFLKAMGNVILDNGEEALPSVMQPFTIKDFDEYLSKLMNPKQHKLVLLLDYDGTLSPIASHPDAAILPAETRSILVRLSKNPRIHMSIVSGREVNNLKKMVDIDNITYAGNHGLVIMHPDGSQFIHPMPPEYQETAKTLLEALQEQVVRDGAWVETKGVYMTWHYRETPVKFRQELLAKTKKIVESHGFIAHPAHMAIEAKPPIKWDKGRACLYILRTAFGLDWSERIRIIYVGDDYTDEDAIEALKGIAVTFRVTEARAVRTVADHRLPDTDSVLTLLKWVEKQFSELPKKSN